MEYKGVFGSSQYRVKLELDSIKLYFRCSKLDSKNSRAT